MPISVVLMLAFGAAGFLEVRRFVGKHGVLPWNGSPAVWACVIGLGWWLALVPVLFLVLAERAAVRQPAKPAG